MRIKLYSLVLPCVVAASAAVFGYPYLYRLLVLDKEAIWVGDSVGSVWIPFVLAILCATLFHNKLKHVWKFKKKDRGFQLVIALCAMIWGATYCVQQDIQASFGRLGVVQPPFSTEQLVGNKYLTVQDVGIDHSRAVHHTSSRSAYRQGTMYEAYFAAPLVPVQKQSGDSNQSQPFQLWMCIQYEESIRGTYPSISEDVAAFYKSAELSFAEFSLQDVQFFERLTDRNSMYGTFSWMAQASDKTDNDSTVADVLLWPHVKPFKERAGHFFIGGVMLFILAIGWIAVPLFRQPLRDKEL